VEKPVMKKRRCKTHPMIGARAPGTADGAADAKTFL
jgi:hypothetical protein